MPDFALCLKAFGAAALISAVCMVVGACGRRRRNPGCSKSVAGTELVANTADAPGSVQPSWRLNWSFVIAFAAGISGGVSVLQWRFGCPPSNALERCWTLVIPALLAMELVVSRWIRHSNWIWLFRTAFAMIVPRVLLHGSVYLNEQQAEWSVSESIMVIFGFGISLSGIWWLLARLATRTGHWCSIAGTVCLSLACSGLAILLSGYLKGGIGALLLATTIVSTMLAARIAYDDEPMPMALGLGVVCLFSTVQIGYFFGRLRTDFSIIFLVAPVLGWVTELRWLRGRPAWLVHTIRFLLVAGLLLGTVVAAKRFFDRDIAPLLGGIP
jgi:hypothetical protein